MSEQYKQYSKKDKLSLKYAPVQQEVKQHISQVLDGMGSCQEVREHIDDLYKLIEHQMLKQIKQEKDIIAVKHMEAWKRYETREHK